MALATAMYYSQRNPLKKLSYKSDKLFVAKDIEQRRLQKAYLRYHDEKGWDRIHESLLRLGRRDLIGEGKGELIPASGSKQKTHRTHRFQSALGGKLHKSNKIKPRQPR